MSDSSDQLPPGFDPAYYLEVNPDVAAAGVDPAEHYVRYGRREGRVYAPLSVKYAADWSAHARAFVAAGVRDDALLLPFIRSELPAQERFKNVMILGSAPSAPQASSLIGSDTIVVAMNNAWRAVPTWDFVVYSDDFPETGKPAPALRARKGVSSPQYLPAMNDCGGLLYCGASMAYAAGYWAMKTFPFAQVSYFASDMTYAGQQSHFYGQGQPDPMRRDISLQNHRAKSLRMFYFGLQHACLFLNASAAAETRLGLPRAPTGESLSRNVLGEIFERLKDEIVAMQELASAALKLERSASFDWRAPEYYRLARDEAAWSHVAAVDAQWLALEESVSRIESAVSAVLSAPGREPLRVERRSGLDEAAEQLGARLEAAEGELRDVREQARKLAEEKAFLYGSFPVDDLQPPVPPEFQSAQLSNRALMKLLADYDFDTVLDIGSGAGEHSAIFLRHGKHVTALDYGKSPYYQRRDPALTVAIGDFNTYPFSEQFDCVWASHVLEHQLNPNIFLKKLHGTVKEGGVVAVTVPPFKHHIVGGHVALWNAGLLIYQLVLAGFSCREASVLRYGYNISVIVKKTSFELPDNLAFDQGDLRKLKRHLPAGLEFASNELDDPFNGDIRRLNW